MQIAMDDLTFENIGIWPTSVKVALIVLWSVLLLIGSYVFYFKDKVIYYKAVEQEEQQLRLNFEFKQRKAANLEAYKEQIAKMQQLFQRLLRQLPSKTEVPALLEDISKIGVAYGLDFQLFDPMAEVKHDFYTELPIRIEVLGNYHALGQFISDLASLPRIVTVHSISIEPLPNSEASSTLLKMHMVAQTYHYIEEKRHA